MIFDQSLVLFLDTMLSEGVKAAARRLSLFEKFSARLIVHKLRRLHEQLLSFDERKQNLKFSLDDA